MATTTLGAAAPGSAAIGAERRYLGWLLALALATRLPLLSNAPAEPDSVRFLLGLWRWTTLGPRIASLDAAVHGAIYGDFLSPGYYAFAAGFVRGLHIPPARFALALNLLSLAAALAAVPLLYRLARLVAAPGAATVATALFLLAPGFWWLGLEPHPQGLATALFLGALLALARAWRRRRRERMALAAGGTALLAAAFLVRADFALFVPALPVLYWMAADEPLSPVLARRALLEAGAVAAASGAAFLGLRSWLLERPFRILQSQSTAIGGGYLHHGWQLLHQQLGYAVKQLLPFPFSVGPWVFLWVVVGATLWIRSAPRTTAAFYHPLLFAVAWSAPGAVFWFLILGNTPRHVVLLLLPWLWLAALGWHQLRRGSLLLASACLAVLLNWATIPPHSNLTLVPSPNLPMSARLIRSKQAQVERTASELVAIAYALGPHSAPLCYFGTETDPLIEWALARRYPATLVLGANPANGASTLSGLPRPAAPIWLYETYDSAQFRRQQPGCAASRSLEVDAVHDNMFMGSEWVSRLRAWRHRIGRR